MAALRNAPLSVTALIAFGLLALPAHAFEVPADEKERLKACEQQLCEIILKKEDGSDLSCAISKTWAKDKIKSGIESKQIDWSLGDARCSIDLKVARAALLAAVKDPEAELALAKHPVKCEVERDAEITEITMNISPKIAFKEGKAVSATMGVTDIEGPALIRGAIWTVAKFEDTFGLFEDDMVSEINEFIEQKCAKRYGSN